MAPYLFALLLLAQDAPAETTAPVDGPVATALPRKQEAPPLPIQGGAVSPPKDDYGYVGWCYGALAGYVDLYDTAMPEVERIERAWPTPSTEENIKIIYPGQRAEARENLKGLRAAMEAAEKASPTPIQDQGTAAIKRGRALWTGSTMVPKAQLAQFWMSWSPPSKCDETAKALVERSNLFGQALNANVAPPAAPAQDKPAADLTTAGEAVDIAEAPVGGSAIDDLLPTAEPEAAVEQAAEPAPPPVVKKPAAVKKPAKPAAAKPAKPLKLRGPK